MYLLEEAHAILTRVFRAVLTHKLEKADASEHDIEKAMYLAALSNYCIFLPTSKTVWPFRLGDPLHNISMTKEACTLHDFKASLHARDPLGVGFESNDLLLRLIWKLLAFDPRQRITAAGALRHPYFLDSEVDTHVQTSYVEEPEDKALEPQMLDARLDLDLADSVDEFVCPKCGRVFQDWRSCRKHAIARRHGRFCKYNKTMLPTCLNGHMLLPAHSRSGHCDIQGRRLVMEDFHAVTLHSNASYFGIFDGHGGSFASKFVASRLHDVIAQELHGISEALELQIERIVKSAFSDVHHQLLRAASVAPHESMKTSGTTATISLLTKQYLLIASVGDSRAVMSSMKFEGDTAVLTARQLTVDHVASNDTEKALVESRGGRIESVNGVYRVNGVLAITRSLGDVRLAAALSTEPDVVFFYIEQLRDACDELPSKLVPCFLVIASDGLWDTMTNEEAVTLAYDTILETMTQEPSNAGSFQRAAEALTLEGYVRGSMDNIGVCVIAIDPSLDF